MDTKISLLQRSVPGQDELSGMLVYFDTRLFFEAMARLNIGLFHSDLTIYEQKLRKIKIKTNVKFFIYCMEV